MLTDLWVFFFLQGQCNWCSGVQWPGILPVWRLCVQKDWGKCHESIQKGQGCLLENLKKKRERYKDPVLWAWLAIFLTWMVPIRKHHITYCCLFLAQYPKRFRESSHWTRKRYQNSAFDPYKVQRGEITAFVLWSGRFCPCTCKILLIIAKAWLRCLPFLYKSGNVHVKYTFCLPFCCNIFQLRPGEIINGKYCECSNLDCPSDPDTDLICGGKVHNNLAKQEKIKRSPT